jgi:inositol-phosphate phosphatase/L-galactose 1-phosphate phosphatase/histidinol-phosphatase
MKSFAKCPAEFLNFAGELADAAGAIVRRYFRTKIKVVGKSDASPVTIADRKAEVAMRALIAKRYPSHGIVGEEYGVDRKDAQYVWVLDPIDGTKSFICGVPVFGTLIALLHCGVPVLGVIDQPIIHERWIGAAGRPTRFCGRKAATRRGQKIGDAVMFSTSPQMFSGLLASPYERLRRAVKLPRYGTDCYAYGQLACGHIDIVVEAGLKPHDFLAQVPIIQGAGGVLTDWEGKALGLESGPRICAAGDARLHREALRLLAG